jgi:hypothetical protein
VLCLHDIIIIWSYCTSPVTVCFCQFAIQTAAKTIGSLWCSVPVCYVDSYWFLSVTSITHTLTHTHTHTHSHSLTFLVTLSLTLSLSLTLTHTHPFTLTHSLTLSLSLSLRGHCFFFCTSLLFELHISSKYVIKLLMKLWIQFLMCF